MHVFSGPRVVNMLLQRGMNLLLHRVKDIEIIISVYTRSIDLLHGYIERKFSTAITCAETSIIRVVKRFEALNNICKC